MKILISLAKSNIWYHGSKHKFDRYDLNAPKLNRGSNPHGIYLTQDKNLAIEFAGTNGYVYTVEPKIRKTFYYKLTEFTDEFVSNYRKAILKYTNYKRDWIDDALIPQLHRENRMKADFSGELYTEVYVSSGYDSLLFQDMRGESLVVFDPDNIEIKLVEQI